MFTKTERHIASTKTERHIASTKTERHIVSTKTERHTASRGSSGLCEVVRGQLVLTGEILNQSRIL